MKTKVSTQIKKLDVTLWLKGATYAVIGFVFTGGRLGSASHPFGIPLAAALTGGVGAAGAALGCIVGSVNVRFGWVYAAVSAAVFCLRLVIGKWLNASESEAAAVYREDGFAVKKVSMKAVAYLKDAFTVSFGESVYVRLTLALAGSLVYGAVRLALGAYGSADLVGAVISAVLSPLLTYLYSLTGTDDSRGVLREAGDCAVALSLVVSVNTLIPYFNGGVSAAFAVTVLATAVKGALKGCVYGILCGAVLTPALAPMYALSALTVTALWGLSPAVAVTAACTVSCVWSVYAGGLSAMNSVIPELIITGALIAPIASSGMLRAVREREGKPVSVGDVSSELVRREASQRMLSLSGTLKELSGVLCRLSDTVTAPCTEDLCALCDDAFEESCSACGMKSACFGREKDQTEGLKAKMVLSMKSDGRVSAAVVPQYMAKRCYSMGRIIDRLNAGCAAMLAQARLYDRTAVVAADYEVMSEILRESSEDGGEEYAEDRALTDRMLSRLRGDIKAKSIGVYGGRLKKVIARGVNLKEGTPGADDVRRELSACCGFPLGLPEFEIVGSEVIMRLCAMPRLEVRCGRASVAMSQIGRASVKGGRGEHGSTRVFSPGEEKRGLGKTSSDVCGDVISAFMTSDGRFFMLISDGMGSGREASLTSGVCAVFIEKLLKAGASMDTSLKMLNSMLRSRGDEISATVDLMELDLMNGRTRFVKSGAAPSFVLRGGRLFRLQSKTVPIGIVRALDAEMIKFETEPGDVIVMLSDGVARSFEDCPWLYDMLCDESKWENDPEIMARKIIKEAINNGAEDDITAGVVMVEGASAFGV